jgi:predicted ArsR family transcriptional regulator
MSTRSRSGRFLTGTRGRIVALLRRTPSTVEELAGSLDLTDNAVRAQLAAMERDGLVRQRGARKGTRKPALEYELDPEAETALSRAYVPLVEALVEVLAGWLSREDLEELMREAGRRGAQTLPRPAGTPEERVREAGRVLDELGGLTDVEPVGDGWTIRSAGCPLAELVGRRPETCRALEALVAELTRLQVREVCDRAERPRCRFEIGAAPLAAPLDRRKAQPST